MDNSTFLEQLASQIITENCNNFSDLVVILPNRRAKVFLIHALQSLTEKSFFAPSIISIEDFIEDISGLNNLDSIEVLFQFYTVYCSLTESSKQQPFDQFANWAKIIIQDFNEIDRYLLDANHVLSYIKDIEDIKRWGIALEDKTTLLENYVDFWKLLPQYYSSLYECLLSQNCGYQGLLYREAVAKIASFSKNNNTKTYIFAGFNALNAAEEKIINYLLVNNQAQLFWDIDQVFLKDQLHDAALFTRKYKSNWSYYKTHPWNWITSEFSKEKNIQIIGTPKLIGQAKIVGNIIQEEIRNSQNSTLENTAIVMGDENLLIPMLHSLPKEVEALNITMGFSSKSNPTQLLISKLFKLHTNAIKRNAKSYVFYYKDILDVLSHSLVEPFVDANELVKIIIKNNYTFIPYKKLLELHPVQNELFSLLFSPWTTEIAEVLSNLSNLLLYIKNNLSVDSKDDTISKAFLFSVYKVINKIITFQSKYAQFNSVATLHAVYKQLIEFAEVSFEGEPLSGLQIMGVLESRVLDFETVIITSLNEGKFPAGKAQNSFIPYDVKRELGLPTFKEKDAIYTYHFYHILQRAKNIYLLYNTESEGFDSGEKSRFITQLEVEQQTNHKITHQVFTVPLPETLTQEISIPKSEKVMERLMVLAQVGFSPSALTSYIRNPLQFYFQKILRVRETDEVEEKIALNTLGTIIHGALDQLYHPFRNQVLTEEMLKTALSKVEAEVLTQFKLVYKEGEIKNGRNLLAFEVAKRNVSNFLKEELKSVQKGDEIEVLFTEEELSSILTHPKLPFPVALVGNADRIEIRNGILRIIDYKTGKVEQKQMVLNTWEGLTQKIENDKIIQVLLYALMYAQPDLKLEVGIISFKNLKAGFLPFTFKHDKEISTLIDHKLLERFSDELAELLSEIFDVNLPFVEKKS